MDAPGFATVLERRRAELVLCGHQHVFQLGALPGAGGPVPVVGAPSASLHGGDRHHEGGYILYDLAKADGGWAIDLELRRFDPASGSFARVFKRRLQQAGDGAPGVRLAAAAG